MRENFKFNSAFGAIFWKIDKICWCSEKYAMVEMMWDASYKLLKCIYIVHTVQFIYIYMIRLWRTSVIAN